MYFLAGVIASLFAYIINRGLVGRFGSQVIIFITPIVEEFLKTGLALVLGTNIFLAHLVFGVVEGFYDFKTSSHGLIAGILSVLWHTAFGLATIYVARWMGHIVYGIIAAFLLHYLGNSLVINPKEEER